MDVFIRQLPRLLLRSSQTHYYSPVSAIILNKSALHTSSINAMAYEKPMGPQRWPSYNKRIFPPQSSGEEPRPAVRSLLIIQTSKQLINLNFSMFAT